MNGQVGQTGRAGGWMLTALLVLGGCTAAPESGAGGPVTSAVRAATDRSAAQRSVVTLPSGERMKRVSLPTGYNHVLLGRVDADGKRSFACVDSVPAAESFLAPSAPGSAE